MGVATRNEHARPSGAPPRSNTSETALAAATLPRSRFRLPSIAPTLSSGPFSSTSPTRNDAPTNSGTRTAANWRNTPSNRVSPSRHRTKSRGILRPCGRESRIGGAAWRLSSDPRRTPTPERFEISQFDLDFGGGSNFDHATIVRPCRSSVSRRFSRKSEAELPVCLPYPRIKAVPRAVSDPKTLVRDDDRPRPDFGCRMSQL